MYLITLRNDPRFFVITAWNAQLDFKICLKTILIYNLEAVVEMILGILLLPVCKRHKYA